MPLPIELVENPQPVNILPTELEGQCRVTPVWQLAQDDLELTTRSSEEKTSQSVPQFHPTTQLSGEAVFAFIYASGDRPNQTSPRPSLGSRLRLDFDTSFTGEDQLRFRLQSTNVARLDDVFETDMARLAIQGEDQNQIELSRLDYSFPMGDHTEIFIPIVGGSISDIADTLNPSFSGSGRGAISRFGQRNPLYRQGGGAGVGVSHDVNDHLNLSLGYLSDAENLLPDEDTVAFTQITVKPIDAVSLGLLYAYAFNGLDTGTGSELANDPFDQSDAISSHSVGFQGTAEMTSQLTLTGWAGWTRAIATDLPDRPKADVINWAMILGYSDLLGEGNQLGVIIGYPPQTLQNSSAASLHFELSYKIQMNEHLSITPGLLMITNPEADPNRSPIITGVIRTTFRF